MTEKIETRKEELDKRGVMSYEEAAKLLFETPRETIEKVAYEKWLES